MTIRQYIFLLLTLLTIGYTFAQERNSEDIIGDCDELVLSKDYNSYNRLYPSALIDRARKNLGAFCCTHRKIYVPNNAVICKEKLSDEYPYSPRLYDHLIDVGFRYLDGDSDLQYTPTDGQSKDMMIDKK